MNRKFFKLGSICRNKSLSASLSEPFDPVQSSKGLKFFFLLHPVLLMLASQRIESVVGGWFWEAETVQQDEVPTKRGSTPTFVEWLILSWVSGLIWSEVKQLWDVGLQEYVNDMWNVIDFITNSLYVATVALRIVSYFQVQKEMAFNKYAADLPREKWDTWDPMLISEGLFSAANIFSSLKLVYIFSVNPHLGPLQVSLSRMVMDIMKFFFLYVLVLFAFSSGLNQLLWYYADLEKKRCVDNIQSTSLVINGTADPNACIVWRRFANLFETTQTLFWAVFGLVDLDSFELDGIKIFTRFWGMLMFGTYSVINIVVLLNLLIAMMNHSYQLISERADIEWKFARSRLWISYFEEGGTCPPPFNVIPTPKSFWYIFQWIKRKFCGHSRSVKKEHMRTIRAKQANQRDFIYQTIMRNLVRRYVTVEQRKAESQGVTEDDVNEIKQDISAFRCELVEILKNSGMNTSTASGQGSGAGGKKNRQKERRLMKGFNIAPPQQSTTLPPVAEFISGLTHQNSDPNYEMFGSPLANVYGPGITPKKTHHNPLQQFSSSQSSFGDSQPSGSTKMGKLAPKFHTKRIGGSHKRRWGTLIEAAKSGSVSRFIGRSRSEDSVCNAPPSTNRMDSASHSNSPASDEAITESATDSNPSLDRPDVETPRDIGKETVTHHFHFNALAALKRRRKKFSNSRNASPVLDPPIEHDGVSKNSKKLLKRASSVPTRPTINESIESIPQNSQDVPASADAVSATLTASTTDESVAGHLVIPICPTEPLLAAPVSGVMKMDANGHQQLPNLPNVIPLRGHLHQQGWL